MKKVTKRLALLASLALLGMYGGGYLTSCSSDGGGGENSQKEEKEPGEDATLVSIAVDTANAITTYTKGGVWSEVGLVVKATYDDGGTLDVTQDVTYEFTYKNDGSQVSLGQGGILPNEACTIVVTVSFTQNPDEEDETKKITATAVYEIQVLDYTISIDKTLYEPGTSITDVAVTVTDGTGAEVAVASKAFVKLDTTTWNWLDYTGDTLEAGYYAVRVFITIDGIEKEIGFINFDALSAEQLPYNVSNGENGVINEVTQTNLVDVTSSTGASISFWLDLARTVTDDTYEWESPVILSDSYNTVYIDVGPLGVWLYDGGANIFEGAAERGSDFTAENWTIFCQDGEPQYMTANFDTDGNITYYKNGKKALTYAAAVSVENGLTVADGCAKAIELLASRGCTLHATNHEGKEYTMYDVVINKALTAAEAQAQFLASFSSITINTESATSSFKQNAAFSSKGLVVTGTDSQGNEFDLTDYATVDSSAVDMTTPGEYSVTVTCGTESTPYTVTVTDVSLTSITLTKENVQTTYYTNGTHVPVLNTNGLGITANYSDGTVEDVALSDVEISKLTAATGTQSVTITYGSESNSYDVTVSYLEEVEAGWTGSVTGGAWWTVFAGASNSDGVKVEGGQKLTTTMTITSVGASNWEVAPDVVLYAADAYSEYVVLRADNFGWGNSYSSTNLENDWDWDTFLDYVRGATLTISVLNYGDGSADVTYNFVKTTDGTTVTHYQYYTDIPVLTDNLYANLVFENCNVTFGSAGTPVSVTATATVPTSDISLAKADGFVFTVSGTPVTASGAVIAWFVDNAQQDGETETTFTLSGKTAGTYYRVRVDVTVNGVTYSKSETVQYQ
ncbi:MAG: bacterial Ig-like domain-containing protein [Treponema sp.]|nr:bacterial Ig-like domain-containing protein [Treponema sp.]